MKKAILKASNGLGKVALSLVAVAVFGTLAKADENKQAQLDVQNTKAIDKLLEEIPTDKELLKGVVLEKHNHRIIEPFSCDVALTDKEEMEKQLSNHEELSEERRSEYRSTLATVVFQIRKNNCEGK